MQGMAAMGFQTVFVLKRQTYSYSVWRGKIRMERLFEFAENQIHRGRSAAFSPILLPDGREQIAEYGCYCFLDISLLKGILQFSHELGTTWV